MNGEKIDPLQLTPPDTARAIATKIRKWWPVGLALLLVLIRIYAPATLIENVYSRGVFVAVREVWDLFLPRFSPLPLYYFFWVFVAWRVFVVVRAFWRGRRSKGVGTGAGWELLRRLLLGTAWLITIFLLGWGFNYGRVPVDQQLDFERFRMTEGELRDRVTYEARELARLRAQLTTDTLALTAADLPGPEEVRAALKTALRNDGYPTPGRPRVRQLYPRGILLSFSTAGVYWPWAGEGNVDAGLHPLQKPAVGAHEMAHAYGFGDEGTCTFWAWRAGHSTKDASLAYPLRLGYWRRIAGKLRQLEPEAYWAWRAAELDPGIRNDLQAIYDNAALYRDLAPALRDATYDTYLKVQGVQEGLLNYGTVIELVEGYRRGNN